MLLYPVFWQPDSPFPVRGSDTNKSTTPAAVAIDWRLVTSACQIKVAFKAISTLGTGIRLECSRVLVLAPIPSNQRKWIPPASGTQAHCKNTVKRPNASTSTCTNAGARAHTNTGQYKQGCTHTHTKLVLPFHSMSMCLGMFAQWKPFCSCFSPEDYTEISGVDVTSMTVSGGICALLICGIVLMVFLGNEVA